MWEYKVVDIEVSREAESTLNDLGGDNWELVSCMLIKNNSGCDFSRHTFRRTKVDDVIKLKGGKTVARFVERKNV